MRVDEAGNTINAMASLLGKHQTKKEVDRILRKGDSLRGTLMRNVTEPDVLGILIEHSRDVLRARKGDVSVTCVPRQNPILQKYFPGLPQLPLNE
jgi:hypothetical protein